MTSNLIKSTLRHLRRNKAYTSINVIGLSVVFATVSVLGLFIFYERTFDGHIPGADLIYRVHSQWDEGRTLASTPPPLAASIMQDIPEVSAATRIFKRRDFTLRSSESAKYQKETSIFFADENYFEVFEDQIIAGDLVSALVKPGSIVLSASMARKYFPQLNLEEVPGHELDGGEGRRSLLITAVMKDVPARSHFDHTALVSAASIPWMRDNEGWSWSIMYTYIKSDAEQTLLQEKLARLVKERVHPYLGYDPKVHRAESFSFPLIRVRDIHLHSANLMEIEANGSILYVRVFTLAAVLLLILGIANYVNLATAQAIKRTREVGMRRILGAGSGGLISIVIVEACTLSLVAGILSMGWIELFALFGPQDLGLTVLHDSNFFLTLTLILSGAIMTGLIAGIYPAVQATNLKVHAALKKQSEGKNSWMRQSVVVVQFVITSALIVGTGVILSQLGFIRDMNLGFDKENVVVIENDHLVKNKEAFATELKRKNLISEVSFTTTLPAQKEFMVRDISLEDESFHDGMRWMQVDQHYAATLGLKVIAGRFFDALRASDSLAVVINQEAASSLGLKDPVGHVLYINRGENDERKVHIIGVVQNYNSESFYQGIKPVVMQLLQDSPFKDYIAIRIEGNTVNGMDQIRQGWSSLQPDAELNYFFLDEEFDALFAGEQRMGHLFQLFSIIAILVACLGLYGLASFSMRLRTREMGIRKVLGSPSWGLFKLFAGRFLFLALAGFAIAAPALWILMNMWLDRFVFRVDFPIEVYVFSGIIVAGISLLAVTSHSLQMARLNPTVALKED